MTERDWYLLAAIIVGSIIAIFVINWLVQSGRWNPKLTKKQKEDAEFNRVLKAQEKQGTGSTILSYGTDVLPIFIFTFAVAYFQLPIEQGFTLIIIVDVSLGFHLGQAWYLKFKDKTLKTKVGQLGVWTLKHPEIRTTRCKFYDDGEEVFFWAKTPQEALDKAKTEGVEVPDKFKVVVARGRDRGLVYRGPDKWDMKQPEEVKKSKGKLRYFEREMCMLRLGGADDYPGSHGGKDDGYAFFPNEPGFLEDTNGPCWNLNGDFAHEFWRTVHPDLYALAKDDDYWRPHSPLYVALWKLNGKERMIPSAHDYRASLRDAELRANYYRGLYIDTMKNLQEVGFMVGDTKDRIWGPPKMPGEEGGE